MNKSLKKCDFCHKKFTIESKGSLMYPENSIVINGEGFVFCSEKCMKKADTRIVTGFEVNQILKSLNGCKILV